MDARPQEHAVVLASSTDIPQQELNNCGEKRIANVAICNCGKISKYLLPLNLIIILSPSCYTCGMGPHCDVFWTFYVNNTMQDHSEFDPGFDLILSLNLFM